MTRLPELIQDSRTASRDDDDDGSQAQVAELEELTRTIPKLIGLLPAMVRDQADVRQNVAVATMISGLTRQLDNAVPLALVSFGRLSPNAMEPEFRVPCPCALADAHPRAQNSFAAYRWTKPPSYIMQGPSCTLSS
jgi:hypothetical protein